MLDRLALVVSLLNYKSTLPRVYQVPIYNKLINLNLERGKKRKKKI
jgi:hypothetical protein